MNNFMLGDYRIRFTRMLGIGLAMGLMVTLGFLSPQSEATGGGGGTGGGTGGCAGLGPVRLMHGDGGFGRVVAMDGDRMAVVSGGTVRVMGRGVDSMWSEEAVIQAWGSQNESMMASPVVDLSGDILVVGPEGYLMGGEESNHFGEESARGILVARFDAGDESWREEAILSRGNAGVGFGGAVAVDGETIVVGSSGEGAFIYRYNEGDDEWYEESFLAPPPQVTGPDFGALVAVEGDLAVVASRIGGEVGLYRYDGVAWTMDYWWREVDSIDDVATNGELVVVGIRYRRARPTQGAIGGVCVYRKDAGIWYLEDCLYPPDSEGCYGVVIDIEDDLLVVGDPGCCPVPGYYNGVGGSEDDDEDHGDYDPSDGDDDEDHGDYDSSDGDDDEDHGDYDSSDGDDDSDSSDDDDQDSAFVCDLSGRVFVYRRDVGRQEWNEVERYDAPIEAAGEWFGLDVAMSAGRIAVGAPGFDRRDGGSVYGFGIGVQGADCNGNGFADDCDIATGTSLDCDGDGVPDECEVPLCPADIAPPAGTNGNTGLAPGDGIVDVQDLIVLINAFGSTCPGNCPPSCPADIAPAGGDGAVDVQDLVAMINAIGGCL